MSKHDLLNFLKENIYKNYSIQDLVKKLGINERSIRDSIAKLQKKGRVMFMVKKNKKGVKQHFYSTTSIEAIAFDNMDEIKEKMKLRFKDLPLSDKLKFIQINELKEISKNLKKLIGEKKKNEKLKR